MATTNNTQQYKWENDYYKNLYDEGVKNLNKEYLDTALKAVSQQNQAAYALRKQEQQQAEQSFYQQLYNTNQTVMDTLRKNNASAIASGASKGAQAANELSAILQGQQTGVQASTDLANENYNLAAEAQQTNAQNMLTATESAQNAAAQAAIGLADTLKSDQAQWVENQISNYLAELAAGKDTTLSQTDWLQRVGWLKAHNVDIDFENAEGYKDTYHSIFGSEGSPLTDMKANNNDNDINDVTNNASRVYKFKIGDTSYTMRAAGDTTDFNGTRGSDEAHNAMMRTPAGEYRPFKVEGIDYIVYNTGERYVIFYRDSSFNSKDANKEGFSKAMDALTAKYDKLEF